jgi:hypothetical protein
MFLYNRNLFKAEIIKGNKYSNSPTAHSRKESALIKYVNFKITY